MEKDVIAYFIDKILERSFIGVSCRKAPRHCLEIQCGKKIFHVRWINTRTSVLKSSGNKMSELTIDISTCQKIDEYIRDVYAGDI